MNPMRRLRLSLGILVAVTLMVGLFGLIGTKPALAEAETFTVSTTSPINIFAFVSCANGGAGEEVLLSGESHLLFHFTLDGSGGFHLKFHENYQGIRGTGQTTGDEYHATGVAQGESNGTVGSEQTFITNLRIIGQGPGNNFLAHDNFHITINADGTVTSFHRNLRIECQ